MPRADHTPITQQRARGWGPLTVWDDLDAVERLLRALDCGQGPGRVVRYLVYQRERCPDTGNLHLQLFLQFNQAVRGAAVQKLLYPAPCDEAYRSRVHLEVTKSADGAKTYCSKPETRIGETYECGDFTSQGKRSDLQRCAEAVLGGTTIREAFVQFPSTMVRYHRGIEALQSAVARPRNRPPVVLVYWGESGSGKSRRAFWEARHGRVAAQSQAVEFDRYGDHQRPFYPILPGKPGGQDWWCTYTPGQPIILDDYHGEMGLNQFKRLLDRYPMKVQPKGGAKEFTSNLIFITSNHNPMDWYPEASQADRDAIHRRFTSVVHFSVLGNTWREPWLCASCNEEPT